MVDLREDLAPLDVALNQGASTTNAEAVGAVFRTAPTTFSEVNVQKEINEGFSLRSRNAPGFGPSGRQYFYTAPDGSEVEVFSPTEDADVWEQVNPTSRFETTTDRTRALIQELTDRGITPPMTLDEFDARREAIIERERAAYEERLSIVERSPNPFRSTLLGEVGAGFTDPVNLATLPVGASVRSGWLAVVATEAALNAAIEAGSTPARNQYLSMIGQEEEDVLINALYGAAFGGLFGGTIAGGQLLAPKIADAIPRSPGKALAREMDAALGELDGAGADAMVRIGRLFQDPALRRDVAERLTQSDDPQIAAAAEMVLRDVEDTEAAVTNPSRDALNEAEERAQEGAMALEAGREPNMPDRPVTAVPAPSLLGGGLQEFDPRALIVDPERFQFKSEGVGSEGLTPKLQGVQQWDPLAVGTIIVFEDINGNQFVADGHQRTGLAKRLMDSDPSQEIRMAGFVLREDDGFSPEAARKMAALVNVMQAADGMTKAMARDAAKILRVSPEDLSRLPQGPGLQRARDLARLGDDAFALVINDVVPDRFAALVGQLIDDPKMQMAMMRLMERASPATEAQAESILRQAMAAPVTQEVTEDLFGSEVIAESLYMERAKVLERAMQMMREDERTFKTLTERADTITSTGTNALDEVSNADMRKLMQEALHAVDKLAYRAGPISEALDNGAQTYKTNGRLKDAAGNVVSAIRAELERNGLAGAGARNGGRDAKSQGTGEPTPDPNQGFDDPINGAGIQEQIAATRFRDLDANERPAEGFNSDEEARADLGRRISAGAERAELDAHPAVVAAVQQLEERAARATNLNAAYGGAEWHGARQYVYEGQEVQGTAAMLPNWIAQAESFAGGEVKRDRLVTIVLGPPAAGKSTIAESLARTKGAAILDSDEIKATLPEFEGGIGAAAVHEESSDLAELLEDALRSEGTNIVFPKVGGSEGSISAAVDRFKADGYTVEIVNMAVTPENAYKRMLGRFVAKGRLIPPDYLDSVGDKPSATYATLRDKGAADGYANIDNNGGIQDPKPILEATGQRNPLAGSEFDLPESRGSDGVSEQPSARGDSEETPEGTQILIEGVAPITARERVQAAADRPLLAQTRVSDSEVGGLFDANDPARNDLFDQVPVGVREVDGEMRAEVVSRSELEAEMQADEDFAEQIGFCLK